MEYFRTNKPAVDEQLDAFIAFSERFTNLDVSSIYLLGSYADGSEVPSSDLDIAVVYKDSPGSEEEARGVDDFFKKHSRALFKVEVDLYLVSLDQIDQLDESELLTREGVVNVKLASELIHGVDVRDRISLPDSGAYVAMTVDTPFHFMRKMRGDDTDTLDGIDHPDPDDYFFGYLHKAKETHAGLETKPILTLIGWIATALVAIKSGVPIGKKSDVPKLYQQHVDDNWADFITHAYQLIRNDLGYQLPGAIEHKQGLREICKQLIEFERFYLQEHEQYARST